MLYVQTVHGGASGLWGLAGQGKVPGDRSAEGREIVGMVCAVMNFFSSMSCCGPFCPVELVEFVVNQSPAIRYRYADGHGHGGEGHRKWQNPILQLEKRRQLQRRY